MAFWESLLDLLFPPKCIYCGRLLNRDACALCGDTLPFLRGEAVLSPGRNFHVCYSAAAYEGGIRAALIRYKFHGQKQYAGTFAKTLADILQERWGAEPPDLVTWIPVSAETLRTRGYDQARLLAEEVARRCKLPARALLRGPPKKTAQSSLSAAERVENIKGAFTLLPDAAALLAGKRVLLVDDILTTGATLEEAAGVLCGASVLCATFARTDQSRR